MNRRLVFISGFESRGPPHRRYALPNELTKSGQGRRRFPTPTTSAKSWSKGRGRPILLRTPRVGYIAGTKIAGITDAAQSLTIIGKTAKVRGTGYRFAGEQDAKSDRRDCNWFDRALLRPG